MIDRSLLGRCFWSLFLPIFQYCSAVWCSAADTHLKLPDREVTGCRFLTWVCLSVTLLIVDLWQYSVCCIRSGVIRCTLLMVLYLDRMCQCGLLTVPWSHGILMRRLAAEPRSAVGLSFHSVSLWNGLADPVLYGVGLAGFKSRANAFLLA